MSNIGQFYGKTFPFGASVTMPHVGDFYDPGDGTLWMAATGTSAFDYTPAYSYLPDSLTSPHSILIGPESGGNWSSSLNSFVPIAYNPSGPLYVTAAMGGNATTGYYYYTSSDGSTWTKRTFPNSKIYTTIQYVGGKFIALARSTTTNGVITSTDGINWSSYTGVSIANFLDIVSNGTNIVIYPLNGTTAAYSTDGGSTWTSTTLPATSVNVVADTVGCGALTWNAGAGLFIGATTTAGAYQTSTNGITWTLRSSQPGVYSTLFGTTPRYASSATTTVAIGSLGGFFTTTTDGLNWSNPGLLSDSIFSNGSSFSVTSRASCVYYDGTRFVVRYAGRTFYSVNGISWTEATPSGGSSGSSGSNSNSSNGIMFQTIDNLLYYTKIIKIADVTATTRKTVLLVPGNAGILSAINYYRIR